jgi:vacuolar protein sorting-associated protein 51
MSTIASPRASTSIRSNSSTRTSLDQPNTRPSQPAARRTRADRAALRDYYGLKSADNGDGSGSKEDSTPTFTKEEIEVSELDKEGFDAVQYVKDVSAKEGLQSILKIEAGLIGGA